MRLAYFGENNFPLLVYDESGRESGLIWRVPPQRVAIRQLIIGIEKQFKVSRKLLAGRELGRVVIEVQPSSGIDQHYLRAGVRKFLSTVKIFLRLPVASRTLIPSQESPGER